MKEWFIPNGNISNSISWTPRAQFWHHWHSWVYFTAWQACWRLWKTDSVTHHVITCYSCCCCYCVMMMMMMMMTARFLPSPKLCLSHIDVYLVIVVLSDLLLTMAYMLGVCSLLHVGRNVHMCCCKYGVPVQCRPNPSNVIWENNLRGVSSELKVQTSVLYDMVLERESRVLSLSLHATKLIPLLVIFVVTIVFYSFLSFLSFFICVSFVYFMYD